MSTPEVSTNEVDALAAAAWDAVEAAHPLHATAIGDRRFDNRLPANDPAEVDADARRFDALRTRVEALARDRLATHEPGDTGPAPADRITLAALADILRAEIDTVAAGTWQWAVDPLEGPQVELLNVPSYHVARSPAEADALVERWQAMGPWIDRHAANVHAALGRGLVSPAAPVRRVIDALDELLARPDEDWPLLRPATTPVPGQDAAGAARLRDALRAAVRDGVRPAFARYRALLVEEVLPAARPDDRPGLAHVIGGEDAYRRLARAHTSLDLPPEDIHRIGLAEVERIDDELATLGRRTLRTGDRAEIQRRLRHDPALHFATADEVFDAAARSLERAQGAIGGWFGIVPRATCEVVAMPPYDTEHSTIAYYREPSADGARPGQYFINTSHPETRPRYEAETLAFHESVPGHHLQLAIAQELDHLPLIRRHAGSTAYVEGWGLYTEGLSDEMGLYTGDLDRIGILSFDGWRACRLVVDTGMHALGWSRRRAIEFMVEHTVLAENNIVNEVDRYISWPGQALAYKLGQLEILRLRAHARATLGDRFDIRRFHDAVLGEGALPLGALREVVEGWAASGG